MLVLALVSVFATAPSHADQNDLQSWTILNANVPISNDKRWQIYFEAQPRMGDDISQMERLLIRPALGYRYDEQLTFHLGYAWTPTFMDTEYQSDFRNENRIWQQATFSHSLGYVEIVHRLRQEQRFIDDASSVSNRFRYLLRGSYKFCDCQDWGITGYNELFVNLNSVEQGPRAGFDRNRVFAGPFFEIGKSRLEVGYIGEYGKRFGNDERMIHALATAYTLNF
jgi:hypothetical protein